jgi:protein-tyrosine-phosphatase
MPASTPFAIVTICTGNICRSPAMGLLLAHELATAASADGPRFAVSSAGTHAMTGWPVNPPMDSLLQTHGVEVDDVRDFTARQATRALLADAGLILTATREHREWVVDHAPSTVRRAFTLTEFADAVAPADNAALSPAELVAWAAAHRPSPGLVSRDRATRRGYAEGDVLDPYGEGDAAYEAAFAQIAAATGVIAAALRATVD